MGRPVNPIPPGKVHHVPAPSRGMEAQQHDKAILGKPAKAKGYPVAVHDAMHHVQDGAFNAGISKTESAAALQGYELPTDPAVQHGPKSTADPGVPSAHAERSATRRLRSREWPRHPRSSHRRDRRPRSSGQHEACGIAASGGRAMSVVYST